MVRTDHLKVLGDSYGNFIGVDDYGNVYLQLNSENRMRKLGMINDEERKMIIKRERKKHLFRKGNAYGFNDFLLRNTQRFDIITLIDDYQSWKIPVKEILEKGFYLNFKEQGFELQIFMSLENMESFKIESYV